MADRQTSAVFGGAVAGGCSVGGRGDDEWRTVIWNYHESNLRMRARSGAIWIVTVDNSHPDKFTTASPCGVINPEGGWVIQNPSQGEQFFVYGISL